MQADDLPPPLGIAGHGDYRGHRDDAATLALAEGGGGQPEIRPSTGQRPVEEGADTLVARCSRCAAADADRAARALHSFETVDFEMPDSPIACTRSSTHRVETPPIQASWITATSALSEVFLGSRKGGK